jgi:hypothetical protein
MSNRDWVCVSTDMKITTPDGNIYLNLAKKCDHKDDPKDTNNVRVDTHIWALWLKPKKVNGKDYTEYYVISQFDPNGWVPEYIMSWGISSLPKTIESELIEGCDRSIKKNISIENFKPKGLNDITPK